MSCACSLAAVLLILLLVPAWRPESSWQVAANGEVGSEAIWRGWTLAGLPGRITRPIGPSIEVVPKIKP